jgi:hypothetical protein
MNMPVGNCDSSSLRCEMLSGVGETSAALDGSRTPTIRGQALGSTPWHCLPDLPRRVASLLHDGEDHS